ncbi:alpha/beta fold hydrolase [Rhodophyticola sp. CCM32]|uniref:alpha/beta hydrolase n=1 Tax=Rhodophyticola sp. CCM32 TaxID=2916397 RepID=UPI00107F504F|nr:alpha/beta fold hydrolase [Rhodophyticola sp. CCM32]QBY02071.1 alpha/beta fold hydrolase [Rhodophyticola sp. CCM32]
MARLFIFLAVLSLGACAPRAQLVLVPDPSRDAVIETVLVATTRAFAEGQFTSERSEGLHYARFDVAIPPERESGEVSWPRHGTDLQADFVVSQADTLTSPGDFRAALRREIAARPRGEREVMVFIHGFNSTFADGLYRTAQIRHDLDIPVIPVHYSWPSAGHPLGYIYDRDSALLARDGLEELLNEIIAAGAEDVGLMAHSLGAEVVMESLRQLRIGGQQRVFDRLSGVLLLSPDIDVQIFRSQAARIGELPQPFFIFTSQRDAALRLSARVRGQQNRLGNIESIEDVADLDVTIIDVSEFSGGRGDGLNHATPVSSPAMIQILTSAQRISASLSESDAVRAGLLPGVVLTVRNATQIILTPDI